MWGDYCAGSGVCMFEHDETAVWPLVSHYCFSGGRQRHTHSHTRMNISQPLLHRILSNGWACFNLNSKLNKQDGRPDAHHRKIKQSFKDSPAERPNTCSLCPTGCCSAGKITQSALQCTLYYQEAYSSRDWEMLCYHWYSVSIKGQCVRKRELWMAAWRRIEEKWASKNWWRDHGAAIICQLVPLPVSPSSAPCFPLICLIFTIKIHISTQSGTA